MKYYFVLENKKQVSIYLFNPKVKIFNKVGVEDECHSNVILCQRSRTF